MGFERQFRIITFSFKHFVTFQFSSEPSQPRIPNFLTKSHKLKNNVFCFLPEVINRPKKRQISSTYSFIPNKSKKRAKSYIIRCSKDMIDPCNNKINDFDVFGNIFIIIKNQSRSDVNNCCCYRNWKKKYERFSSDKWRDNPNRGHCNWH